MRNRLLTTILILFLIVGALATVAMAADDTWLNVVTTQPDGFNTDTDGNVSISSAEGLAWLAQQVNEGTSFSGKTITLSKSIDLSAHEWVPIGTQAHPFDGTFDGGNYQISGMNITVSETNTIAGLFGYVGTSTIQNVVMEGSIIGSVTANSDCIVNLGGLVGANDDRTNVTINNCGIDAVITLATTGDVETNIGGIIGYVDDYSNTYTTIRNTDVDLSVVYTSADTNNTTNIGGVVGDMHSYKNTSFIENGDVELSVSITGRADGWSTLYHIGGVVGYMPTHGSSATNTVVSLQNMNVDTKLDFTSSSGILIDAIVSAPAEIGGFFGRGFRYRVTDCFAKTLLRGPDDERPSHYGNLAGYTYNDKISCERVYTYASRYEGNTLFENERLSRDNSNMPNYPLTDVYYIEPQELIEGVEGVPFLYKTFHDSHGVTSGINDGFVYRDGDSGDGITVTPGADGKTVAITPANERCAVGGHLDLSSGFEVDFVLPVPVYPDGGGTYDITTEVNDLTRPGGYTSCKVTTEPVEKAKAGDLVTITAKPVPSSLKLVDSVTVTTEGGTPVNVTKTDGDVTGNQTYTFTMPASNVTITGVFRAISTEFTLSPSPVTFDVYEGYTAEDVEPQTVTITNTGDKDVTFEGSYALPTSTYYEIQPDEGNWGGTTGREITIAPGETATFTVAPKPGLTSATNPNTVKPLFYSTEKERVYLTLQCNVTQAPVYTMTATPDPLSFGQLYEGYTAPSGQTVTLTNTGTGTLNVTLPTSEHFTITPDASWNNGAVSLAPNETATVTVTPKQGLTAGTYQDTLRFTTDQTSVKADVSVSFSVVSHGDITITPADITIYMGGEGYEGTVGSDGELVTDEEQLKANGFPEPGFLITLPEALQGIDVTSDLTLIYKGEDNEAQYRWKFEKYGAGDHNVYRIVPMEGTDKRLVRMQFTSGKTVVTDDQFNVAQYINQTLTMKVYGEGIDKKKVSFVYNGQAYPIAVKNGQLTVRGTTADVKTAAVDIAAATGTPGVTAPAGTTYTINSSSVQVDPNHTVALLFDGIIDSLATGVAGETYTQLLKDKVDAALGSAAGATRAYDCRYLDLVDQSNGNAWVTASNPVTVYWPLPQGTSSSTHFTLLHFEGLHRSLPPSEITSTLISASYTPKEVSILRVTDTHVVFEVSSGGFSPFVLVYEEPAAEGSGIHGIDKALVSNPYEYYISGVTYSDLQGTIHVDRYSSVTLLYRLTVTGDPGAAYTVTDLGVVPVSGSMSGVLDSTGKAVIYATRTFSWNDILLGNGWLSNTATVLDADNKPAGTDTVTTPVSVDWPITPPVTPPVTPEEPDEPDQGPDGLNTQDHYAYIVGYPDGTVRPEGSITRAEVATIFFRLLTDEVRAANWSQVSGYTDVTAGSWYNNAISTLSRMGILEGYDDDTFRPNGTITRAEFVTIATRFFRYSAKYTGGFSDVPSGAWYADYIQAGVDLGLIGGYPDGTFVPDGAITRAEACAIVNRTLGRKPHADYLLAESVMNVWPDNLKTAWYYADIQEATNSHDYDWVNAVTETLERWTAKLPERDWAALEKAWSTAYSAPGNDVMD